MTDPLSIVALIYCLVLFADMSKRRRELRDVQARVAALERRLSGLP